jgi:hypothetical protein
VGVERTAIKNVSSVAPGIVELVLEASALESLVKGAQNTRSLRVLNNFDARTFGYEGTEPAVAAGRFENRLQREIRRLSGSGKPHLQHVGRFLDLYRRTGECFPTMALGPRQPKFSDFMSADFAAAKVASLLAPPAATTTAAPAPMVPEAASELPVLEAEPASPPSLAAMEL